MLEQAQRVLKDIFGYDSFRGRQGAIIERVASGGDALVLMPTGGGKSLCFQVPALLREGLAVVVSPLIALMDDQVATLEELGVAAAALNSTLSAEQQRDLANRIKRGEVKMLYLAPERLVQPRMLAFLQSLEIALFAIDEAHCVSQWGHDFRREYLQLGQLAELFPNVPRIALTATADKRTREEIVDRLHLQDAERFLSSFDRPNIFYRIVPMSSRASSCWRSWPSGAATPVSSTACRARKSTKSRYSSASRGFRRCLITPGCPTKPAPITRSAFSTRKA